MVGILRSLTSRKLSAAASASIFCFITAFQKALAPSSQNRSGTTNISVPERYDANSSAACKTRFSSSVGIHHLTATLASTTLGVTFRDPHESFLQRKGRGPV